MLVFRPLLHLLKPLLIRSNRFPPYTNQIRFRVSIMLMDPFLACRKSFILDSNRIQNRPFLLALDLNFHYGYGALPPLQEDGVSTTGLLYLFFFGTPHLLFSSSPARQTVIDSSLLFSPYFIGTPNTILFQELTLMRELVFYWLRLSRNNQSLLRRRFLQTGIKVSLAIINSKKDLQAVIQGD